MIFKRTFYRCNVCGNIFDVVEAGGGKPQCCGQPMEMLVPNSVDAAAEKHVPCISRKGMLLEIKVGEVAHPQTKEHHISFIAVAQEMSTFIINLDPEAVPEAIIEFGHGDATVYAYCNLHGLWSADLKDEFNFEADACSAEFSQGCTEIYE